MGTRTFLFFVSVGCLSTLPVLAADWAQWRGPQRTGVSAEQGLAHQWPKDGPPLVWHVKDVGNGYGSPSVVGQRVYLLAVRGWKRICRGSRWGERSAAVAAADWQRG